MKVLSTKCHLLLRFSLKRNDKWWEPCFPVPTAVPCICYTVARTSGKRLETFATANLMSLFCSKSSACRFTSLIIIIIIIFSAYYYYYYSLSSSFPPNRPPCSIFLQPAGDIHGLNIGNKRKQVVRFIGILQSGN